jgi:hypothetical protein
MQPMEVFFEQYLAHRRYPETEVRRLLMGRTKSLKRVQAALNRTLLGRHLQAAANGRNRTKSKVCLWPILLKK